jgi:DNA-binding MarR family transcriptional regulator
MSNDSEESAEDRPAAAATERPQAADRLAAGLSEERAALLQELIRVNRAYQSAVEKLDEAFFRRIGVNRTDGRCLDVIDQRPGLTAGELADAVGLSRGAVTTALDRLEARGLVTRARDSEDRRRVTLTLTPEANRIAWETYGPLAEMAAPRMSELADDDIEVIIRFLQVGTDINERRANQVLANDGSEGDKKGGKRPA